MDEKTVWTIIITATLTAIATVATTLIGAYVTYRLGLAKDKNLRQEELDRHARYLAIRVVCKLDPFVSGCCDVVYDEGIPDHEGYFHDRIDDPTITFPEDVDWKSVPSDLMYRILGFPNAVENANQSVAFVAQEIVATPDRSEYFEERIFQYAQLGLTALALAEEIRKTFNVPAPDFGNHDPKDVFERAISKVTKSREVYQAKQDEMMEVIAAKAKPPEQLITSTKS
jgi:uncharacterized protein YlxP (DUF503 family)